jgi:hypothetical protein
MARVSKEENRAYYRKYYADNKEAVKRNQEKYEEKNPRVHVPDSSREIRLKYHYKMTVDQYEAQLALQGWLCALCPAIQGDDKRRMAVDHDHSCCPGHKTCGKCNRGILCANCNRKLGFLEQLLAEALVMPFPTLIGTRESWTGRALRYLINWEQRHSTQGPQ